MREDDSENLLTVAEVARITGFPPRTIARWIQQGKISCIVTSSGKTLVRRTDVDAIVVSRERNDDAPPG